MEEAASCGGLEVSESCRGEWSAATRFLQVDVISRLWGNFHEGMPYTEAERRWLFENVEFQTRANWRESDMVEMLNENDAHMISGGIHRVVAGREFLPRWVSWRRQIDEFAGQGTVDGARESLGLLIKNVELSG